MLEREWQSQVLDLAKMGGWSYYHTYDSRKSNPGWPDLTLWHPRRRLVIFRELKAETGKLRPGQKIVIDELTEAGADVGVWRPSDLPDVQRLLVGG